VLGNGGWPIKKVLVVFALRVGAHFIEMNFVNSHAGKLSTMTDEIVVEKSKFDTLLRKMLDTPPLPKADIRTPRSKSKPKKKTA